MIKRNSLSVDDYIYIYIYIYKIIRRNTVSKLDEYTIGREFDSQRGDPYFWP